MLHDLQGLAIILRQCGEYGDAIKGNSRAAAARRPGKKNAFLTALADTVNVALACRHAGIPRRTAHDWREKDKDFAKSWDEALDEGIDLLEAELHRRAFEGVERPIFHKGQQVGTWRYYSDGLAMFLLKAHRPEKYCGTPLRQASQDAQAEEFDEKEAKRRAYRAMFERVWAKAREDREPELAAHSFAPDGATEDRPLPQPPPVPADWGQGP